MKIKHGLFTILLSLIFSNQALSQNQDTDLLTVTNFILISNSHVSKSVFDFHYKVSIENFTDQSIEGLRAIFQLDPSSKAELIDNEARFGLVSPNGQAVSEDTITIRMSRKKVGNPELPPELQHVFDNGTITGLDLDGNGVRDDVQAYINSTYKNKPIIAKILMETAKEYNLELSGYTSDEEAEKIENRLFFLAGCHLRLSENSQEEDYDLLATVINTTSRSDAYSNYGKQLGLVQISHMSEEEELAACEAEFVN